MWQLILDILFPKFCVSCGRWGTFFCQICQSKLTYSLSICPLCQHPGVLGETHPKCRKKYSLDGLTSIFTYKQPMRLVIHKLKYKPYLSGLTPILLKLILACLKDYPGLKFFLHCKPTIVPVPLHWLRKHYRGYNQAQLLSIELAGDLRFPHCDLLTRTKITRPQAGLSFTARKENVSDIFTVKGISFSVPENILLVDDVWASGSTLKSCCTVLKKNGARRVWALTLAR